MSNTIFFTRNQENRITQNLLEKAAVEIYAEKSTFFYKSSHNGWRGSQCYFVVLLNAIKIMRGIGLKAFLQSGHPEKLLATNANRIRFLSLDKRMGSVTNLRVFSNTLDLYQSVLFTGCRRYIGSYHVFTQ